MFGPTDSDVLWLNLTNIALGAVTLICLIVVGTMAFREVAARVRKRVTVPIYHDDHAFIHSGLGITMADGGEREDERPLNKTSRDRTSSGDGSNIVRSNN